MERTGRALFVCIAICAVVSAQSDPKGALSRAQELVQEGKHKEAVASVDRVLEAKDLRRRDRMRGYHLRALAWMAYFDKARLDPRRIPALHEARTSLAAARRLKPNPVQRTKLDALEGKLFTDFLTAADVLLGRRDPAASRELLKTAVAISKSVLVKKPWAAQHAMGLAWAAEAATYGKKDKLSAFVALKKAQRSFTAALGRYQQNPPRIPDFSVLGSLFEAIDIYLHKTREPHNAQRLIQMAHSLLDSEMSRFRLFAKKHEKKEHLTRLETEVEERRKAIATREARLKTLG